MCRVLGLTRVAQDRSSEAIGGIEVTVGQPQKGSATRARLIDLVGSTVCQFDDLSGRAHSDMTIERRRTFTARLPLRPGVEPARYDKPDVRCSP